MFCLKKTYSAASVKNKLLTITTLITLLTLILTSVIFILYYTVNVKNNAKSEINILSSVLSKRIAPALDFFGGIEQINDHLSDLSSKNDIVLSCVYDKDNKLITFYKRETTKSCKENYSYSAEYEDHLFKYDFLYITKDIQSVSKKINGKIQLVSDLKYVKGHIIWMGIRVVIVFIVIFIITYLISTKLIYFVTKPVAELAKTANTITETKNYDIVAKKIYDDEIGNLTTIFNNMVGRHKEYNKNLEKLVNKRTKELSDSLVLTQKALEAAKRADRHKSEWIRNVSHEFRTPVHGILSFAHFGEEDLTDDNIDLTDLKKYFQRIIQSGERLSYLVNGILDLAASENEQELLNKQDVEISQLAHNVKNELSGLAKNKNIQIEIKKPHFDAIVNVDEQKIIQVLANLISNAIKFSEPQSVIKIDFDILNDAKNDEYVQTNVSDEGCSVPENELNDIFLPFKQSSNTNDQSGGTGLGLPICKSIIEAHGGKIWAKNNDNKGSTFSFIIYK